MEYDRIALVLFLVVIFIGGCDDGHFPTRRMGQERAFGSSAGVSMIVQAVLACATFDRVCTRRQLNREIAPCCDNAFDVDVARQTTLWRPAQFDHRFSPWAAALPH